MNIEKQIAAIALKMCDNKEQETAIIMECVFALARAIDTLDATTKKEIVERG